MRKTWSSGSRVLSTLVFPPDAKELAPGAAPPVPAEATLEAILEGSLEVRPNPLPAQGLEALLIKGAELMVDPQLRDSPAFERSIESRALRELPGHLEGHHGADALFATTAIDYTTTSVLRSGPPRADPQVVQGGVVAGDELDLLDPPRRTAVVDEL